MGCCRRWMRMRSMEGVGLGGAQNPALKCSNSIGTAVSSLPGPDAVTHSGYGDVLSECVQQLRSPDKGVGVNINIPLRNRTAQADQARSQMEYRQSQMRLQQLYTQIRIQVINGQFALTNDRAQVQAAQAARDFAAQSLDAEQKKYRLGASTTALVLQQAEKPGDGGQYLISATACLCEGPGVRWGSCCRTRWIEYGISMSGCGQRVMCRRRR